MNWSHLSSSISAAAEPAAPNHFFFATFLATFFAVLLAVDFLFAALTLSAV